VSLPGPPALIGPCIDTLLAAMGEDDELIVVDNASTDGSRELLRSYGPRLRLLELDANTYIFGLNRGLELAQGRFVAFLNNDMTVQRDFVNRCVDALNSGGEDLFAVCPRILQIDGGDQGSRTAGFWSRGLIFYRSLPHSDVPTDCFFAVGGQSFFRRAQLQELGSIDPLLWPMYHEDIELSYRAWKRGWRIGYVPEAVAVHVGGHTSGRTFSARQLRTFVRQNEFLIVWQNVTDVRLLTSHVALLPARLVVALVRRDTGTLLGFGRAALRIRGALAARRRARRHFRLTDRAVLERVSGIS
jgi:GT2 family glycosyltransferase